MKKINYYLFIIIIFLISLIPGNSIRPQTIDSGDVCFGFADSSGRFLLADRINPDSRNSYYAVTPAAKIFKLDYIEERKEKNESTGRQTAANFYNLGGFLFNSPYINLKPDGTYLVADSGYLQQHIRLAVEPVSYTPLTENYINQIESIKGRHVKSGWQIGKTDNGIILALILFKPDGDAALASLVLIKNDLIVFEDYPGNLKDEYSVWRADDGGEFDPRSINVIALFHSSEGYEIARTWIGEEGENSVFLVQNGKIFKPLIEYYRYWAAE